jgi:hypothetical protein
MQNSPLCDANGFARQIEKSFRNMWQKWCQAHGVDEKVNPLPRRPVIKRNPRKVLISHHWAVPQIPAERFGDDFYYVSHNKHPDFNNPRVVKVPFGRAYDVADLVRKLPNNWEPDLFVAKVDAFFNQAPINVGHLKCPKVLILGDTQHGEKPLSRMIQYATAEKYDLYITDHKRHHLWYYWLAGIDALYWLPGLFLNPPDSFRVMKQGSAGQWLRSSQQQMRGNPEFYRDKVVFIGQNGRFHPRRGRIIEHLKARVSNFWAQQLPHQESFEAYHRALISLNVSLNGDLNLRVFEVIAANGFLLSDVLSDASGMNLILEDAKDYVGYTSLEDLKNRITELVKSPNLIAEYRQRAFDRYLQDLSPPVMGERFKQLVSGRTIDHRFTSQSLKRIQYNDGIQFSPDRLMIYEMVQEQHKHLELVHIHFDAKFRISSVLDVLDLPRTQVTIFGADEKYKHHLNRYLMESGNKCRVEFSENSQTGGPYDICMTSKFSQPLVRLLAENGVLISSDHEGTGNSDGNKDGLNNVKMHTEKESNVIVLKKM